MQHRAPRPLLDPWRPRVLAPLIAVALAIGGCAGVVSLTGGPSAPRAESTTETPTPGPEGSLPEPRHGPGVPATAGDETARPPGPAPAPSPTSDVSPSVPPTPGERARPHDTEPEGPSPSPSTSTAAEDGTAPSTTLSATYPDPDGAEFLVSASEDASFACSLDGAAFVPCGSPQLYSDLAPGWHTFAVRATDTAGNTDPTPAETRWLATGGPTEDPGAG